MNYALDALWWKLTSQPVRDLASLLTAPPLWQSGCELSVRELLGEHGFRYLLALDADPTRLTDYLAQRAPFGHRLGIYAEELLAFGLPMHRTPNCSRTTSRFPVRTAIRKARRILWQGLTANPTISS